MQTNVDCSTYRCLSVWYNLDSRKRCTISTSGENMMHQDEVVLITSGLFAGTFRQFIPVSPHDTETEHQYLEETMKTEDDTRNRGC